MLECQVNFIAQLIEKVLEVDVVDVKQEAYDEYHEYVQSGINELVFSANCASWYKDADGFNSTNWSGTIREFWYSTLRPIYSDFSCGSSKI